MNPRSAGAGQRRFGDHVEHLLSCSGGLSPVRGREAPCAPSVNLPRSGGAHKHRSVQRQPRLFAVFGFVSHWEGAEGCVGTGCTVGCVGTVDGTVTVDPELAGGGETVS